MSENKDLLRTWKPILRIIRGCFHNVQTKLTTGHLSLLLFHALQINRLKKEGYNVVLNFISNFRIKAEEVIFSSMVFLIFPTFFCFHVCFKVPSTMDAIFKDTLQTPNCVFIFIFFFFLVLEYAVFVIFSCNYVVNCTFQLSRYDDFVHKFLRPAAL